jgi:hypothetical protein
MNQRVTLFALTLLTVVVARVPLDGRVLPTRIDSHWRDREIVIDGSNADWPGPLLQIEEKTPVTIAAVNDGRFLYLVLHASDPMARARIMRQGLIVWFDPSGKNKKQFGIKFPVGMERGDMRGRSGGGPRGMRPGGGTSPDDGTGDSGQRGPEMFDPPNRLELLGAKKDDIHSFVADKVPGIVVKIGQVEGALVYELQVPLAKTSEFVYAIGTTAGALIGIGLETPKIERASSDEGRGRGMGGGGMGGRGMGGRGGRGGGGRSGGGMGGRGMGAGRDTEQMKPMKAWGLLQLAALGHP